MLYRYEKYITRALQFNVARVKSDIFTAKCDRFGPRLLDAHIETLPRYALLLSSRTGVAILITMTSTGAWLAVLGPWRYKVSAKRMLIGLLVCGILAGVTYGILALVVYLGIALTGPDGKPMFAHLQRSNATA